MAPGARADFEVMSDSLEPDEKRRRRSAEDDECRALPTRSSIDPTTSSPRQHRYPSGPTPITPKRPSYSFSGCTLSTSWMASSSNLTTVDSVRLFRGSTPRSAANPASADCSAPRSSAPRAPVLRLLHHPLEQQDTWAQKSHPRSRERDSHESFGPRGAPR